MIAYLLREGIPFIAFRNKKRGWATAAHIHVGRPPSRMAQAKQIKQARREKPTDRG